jgi:3-deoxy-manno-octulosonate cytidylyltransferase (CMP-KDO synthetase)
MSTVVMIPARLDAQRFPNKPLANLRGEPVLTHVIKRALNANLGPVVAAVDSPVLAECAKQAGAEAVLTDPCLASGSDRVYDALQQFDPSETFQTIVNLQGDMAIFPEDQLTLLLDSSHTFDITTLATPIKREHGNNPSSVKAVLTPSKQSGWSKAAYFSRATVPHGAETLWHHIGAYAFQRQALKRFVTLPPSALEQAEKLEQLRALENGLSIGVRTASQGTWISIDTPEDLDTAETYLASLHLKKA